MLLPVIHHDWDIEPRAAVALQVELAPNVDQRSTLGPVSTVAGVDVGLGHGVGLAGVVVMTLPELTVVEGVRHERPVSYPYVPGLLSFREAPVILDALAKLSCDPDVLMFDAQGYAHPRRMGLAAHIGVVLDHPAVGCAKSRLCGAHEEPGRERGSQTWLWHKDEIIGAVVRTRDGVRPVFVSVGHRVTLADAVELVLRCSGGYRLPEPTRLAHKVASSTDASTEGTPA